MAGQGPPGHRPAREPCAAAACWHVYCTADLSVAGGRPDPSRTAGQMNQTPKSDSGVSNDRPGQKDPLWILLERADHQLAQLIVETLRNDGHRVMDGSQGMSLLLNLVSIGLSRVAPEVSAVVICDARTGISKRLAVLGRLLDQGDYCPPSFP